MDEDVQAQGLASEKNSARLRFFKEDIERGLRLVRSAEKELQARHLPRARYLIGEAHTIEETTNRFLTDLPLQYSALRPTLTNQTQILRDALVAVVKHQQQLSNDSAVIDFL